MPKSNACIKESEVPTNPSEGKKTKMKQLSWSKITVPLMQKTVWKEAAVDSVNSIMDLKQLESLFSANTSTLNSDLGKVGQVAKLNINLPSVSNNRKT
jgi:hypothetical protein